MLVSKHVVFALGLKHALLDDSRRFPLPLGGQLVEIRNRHCRLRLATMFAILMAKAHVPLLLVLVQAKRLHKEPERLPLVHMLAQARHKEPIR
jgi:hypothetical protein